LLIVDCLLIVCLLLIVGFVQSANVNQANQQSAINNPQFPFTPTLWSMAASS
jgi:hypothetical protein